MMIYDRASGKTASEKIYESRTMDFLYNTIPGSICAAVLRLPIVSAIYGVFQKSPRSRSRIRNFINDYGIDVSGTDTDSFDSFNDFIIRKTGFTFDQQKDSLIAPSDGCLLTRRIQGGTMYPIKGKRCGLAEFLRDSALAEVYEGGVCLILRLRVYDYHRFCFIDDGAFRWHRVINGFLDSVNTAATGRFTLVSNRRQVSLLSTESFGDIIYAEVGALLVGRIVNLVADGGFRRGDEKGYFEFGGSTIVIILKEGAAVIDSDILRYSAEGIETRVHIGERIGKC